MFIDACAIIAILSDEDEAEHMSSALAGAQRRLTSPIAVLEAVIGLGRPDKFDLPISAVEPIVLEFLEAWGIDILDLPPAPETTRLALSAAHRYRTGKNKLNLGDCLHYACAKHYGVPILATGDEFRNTDLETVPRPG